MKQKYAPKTEKSVPETFQEIRQRIELLEDSLPKRVDPATISLTAKIPYKAISYRESLTWRMAELSRCAFDLFDRNHLASAILLTRAALETSAAVWCLAHEIEKAITTKSIGNIDKYLMRGIVGWKAAKDGDASFPAAHHVMDFIRGVGKNLDFIPKQYDMLSEFAHPNWSGTHGLYAKDDRENFWTDFGVRQNTNALKIGLSGLVIPLVMFENKYNQISDLLPAFIALCEDDLQRKGSEKSPSES